MNDNQSEILVNFHLGKRYLLCRLCRVSQFRDELARHILSKWEVKSTRKIGFRKWIAHISQDVCMWCSFKDHIIIILLSYMIDNYWKILWRSIYGKKFDKEKLVMNKLRWFRRMHNMIIWNEVDYLNWLWARWLWIRCTQKFISRMFMLYLY